MAHRLRLGDQAPDRLIKPECLALAAIPKMRQRAIGVALGKGENARLKRTPQALERWLPGERFIADKSENDGRVSTPLHREGAQRD